MFEKIELINKYVTNKNSIKLYEDGILCISKDSQLIYINIVKDIINNSVEEKPENISEEIISLDDKFFNMDCLQLDKDRNICYIICPKYIKQIDIKNKKLLEKKDIDFNFSNFCFYKEYTFLGLLNKSIFMYNFFDNKLEKLIDFDYTYIRFKNIQDNIFSFVSDNNDFYKYDIKNKSLEKKEFEYIPFDKYKIFDITDTIVGSYQVHMCCCFFGLNKTRTKGFFCHFSNYSENAETIIEEIKTTLKEEYNDMSLYVVGGFSNNKALKYLSEHLKYRDITLKILPYHIQKQYSIFISVDNVEII